MSSGGQNRVSLDMRRMPLRPSPARSRLQKATFRPCIFRSAASNAWCVGNAL
jgi:hypothetical protein